jgi:putative transposase
MCRFLKVHPSGYHAWKLQPQSARAKDDQRLLGLLKLEGLRSKTGCRRQPGVRGDQPAVVAPNHLQRQFTTAQPNQSWVFDITYIRTHEGWLYLAIVVDLFSRQVVGWSMDSDIDTTLHLDALPMALWRRQPQHPVTVHSDQGCQFTGHEWHRFLREHKLVSIMNRRGNCHDNAVTESWFQFSSSSASAGRSASRAAKRVPTSSTTSRGSITPNGVTAPPATLRQSSSSGAIPNGSQVLENPGRFNKGSGVVLTIPNM